MRYICHCFNIVGKEAEKSKLSRAGNLMFEDRFFISGIKQFNLDIFKFDIEL